MGTHGFLIFHGAGLLSIMDVGSTTITTGGLGCRDMSGLLHGYHGVQVADITDGLQWGLVWVSA